eukprot:GHRR01034421.1.p3 GENE.GHRR01034421.1~~GHRR01034421.1.p3  ORF type:complete len:107 (+),score=18.50 GHRR01034421.1:1291-1611(+)
MLDLLGEHTVEQAVIIKCRNFRTGLSYTFEQEWYNPLTRSVRCHVSLQDPSTKRVLKRAFTYNWRLWCLADVVELLREARVNKVHVQGDAGADAARQESDDTKVHE